VESDAIQSIAPECPPLNILKDTTLRICGNRLEPILLGSLVNSPDTGYQFSGPQLSGDTVRFENISEGAHVYQLRLQKGNCYYEDSIRLIKMAVPKIEQIIITPIPCLDTDSTGAIEITRVSGDKTSYSIDGSPYSGSGRFDPVSAGPHLLAVIDSNGCRSDTLVMLIPPERVDIELGQDLEVNRGSLVEINSRITGRYTRITWTGYSGLDCDSCKKVSFRTDKDLTLVAQVSNEYGCTDEDVIKILVRDKRIYAPSSFSPNGDGVNDGFILYGPDENILVNRLEIYDRWGAQIFLGQNLRINDPQNGWNGEFRGQKLMPGVYVYVARVIFEDGTSQQIKGEVTLVR
jgi:gliding motility-associated-like protein